MPGKLDDGINATGDINVTNSKAFCEGRQAKVYGASTNPHVSGTEAFASWAAGYALAASSGVQGPCNIFAGIATPNLVGLSLAVATSTLVGLGLTLGTVTLTTGNVTIQSPVATTIVKQNSLVNVTLTS